MRSLICCGLLLTITNTTLAQVNLPGQNQGSDGPFMPTSNTTIDLSLAATGVWDDPGEGNGIYDPVKWAVVFKYSSVDIPSGVTVSFLNHPSGAPVIWLVNGPVNIAGTVTLNGSGGHGPSSVRTYAVPGPGGFRGGRGSDIASTAAAGFGPGGAVTGGDGDSGGAGGSYITVGQSGGGAGQQVGESYGNAGILPLLGGSGGGGGRNGGLGSGGGAGAGALLIACPEHFQLDGLIRANGGGGANDGTGNSDGDGGGGAGGGIRLIADSIAGLGSLQAVGGSGPDAGGGGGFGGIRVEANINKLVEPGDPLYTFGLPGMEAIIWPDELAPVVRSITLAGQLVPSDPRAQLSYPNADILMSDGTGALLIIETENIPLPPEGSVTVKVAPALGAPFTVGAAYQSTAGIISTWHAALDLPDGHCVIQAHAKIQQQ